MMVAVVDLLESEMLVAVMVTAWLVVIDAGAVYRPVADMVPMPGVRDQVTPVSVVFKTAAVNCCVAAACRVADAGVIDTLTGGSRVMEAVPVVVPSCTLVAVTVTVCCLVTEAGAV